MNCCDWHKPDDVWAYVKHRQKGIPQCEASLAAWAKRQRGVRKRLRKEKRALAERRLRKDMDGWVPPSKRKQTDD